MAIFGIFLHFQPSLIPSLLIFLTFEMGISSRPPPGLLFIEPVSLYLSMALLRKLLNVCFLTRFQSYVGSARIQVFISCNETFGCLLIRTSIWRRSHFLCSGVMVTELRHRWYFVKGSSQVTTSRRVSMIRKLECLVPVWNHSRVCKQYRPQ